MFAHVPFDTTDEPFLASGVTMLRSQSRLRPVPPSPEVFARLYMEFVRNGKPAGLTFAQYLRAIGFTDPSDDIDGMDDSATVLAETPGGPALISVPQQKVVGLVTIIVLLIDFDDLPGQRPAREFEDLLFSDSVYPTGSLRDYFREVSAGKVAVSGTVHGWMRMPKSYSFYTNNESGMKGTSYPRNAQRMAEDAVAVAIADGVVFPATLDVLHTGAVTGLFLIHAGRGAEELSPPMSKQQIWSHKWFLPNPATVNTNLVAGNYLTVPEDCNMGVCAHELGHLAFQWEDFYDTDKALNGQWAGTGSWDLMAGGSWNGFRGDTPAHPIGLHKSQHGWLTPQVITQTTTGVAIPPTSATNGNGVKVIGPAFTATQFLYLENRQRAGFDKALPGDGLLVWRVDLDRLQVGPARPAVQLVQADGRADLESNLNQGDEGDPFPGTALRTSVGDAPGLLTTTFPFAQASGITLSAIVVDAQTGVITLNITIGAANLPMMAQAVHAAPVDPMATALDRLLAQPNVSQSELEPFVRQASPTLLDIERRAFSIEPQSPEEAAPGEQPRRSATRIGSSTAATANCAAR